MIKLDQLTVKGWVTLRHRRAGVLISEETIPNLIVNAGLGEVSGLVNGVVSTAFTYMAIGIGTTSATTADTTLVSEITTGGGERAAASTSQVTTYVTNDTAQWVKEWTFTDSFAITEAGIFNAASAGDMLNRQTFTARNVINGDTFQLTWRVCFH